MVPEDIISIKGQQVEIGAKESTAPVNSSEFLPQELKQQWIELKQSKKDVTFLDSWELKEAGKKDKVHVVLNVPPHLGEGGGWVLNQYVGIGELLTV